MWEPTLQIYEARVLQASGECVCVGGLGRWRLYVGMRVSYVSFPLLPICKGSGSPF